MAKKDFINVIAVNGGIPIDVAEKVYAALIDYIVSEIKSKSRLLMPGLGSFKLKHYESCKRRNPKTGEAVTVPPRDKVVYKMSKGLV